MEIFDEYVEDLIKQEKAKEKKGGKGVCGVCVCVCVCVCLSACVRV